MLSVHLSNLVFHGPHGVHEGEAKVGNTFEVEVTVKYDEGTQALDDVHNVINYEDVYDIVRKRMAIPASLLEELAQTLVRKIKHQYKQVAEISVTIFKVQPPITGMQGKVGITLHKVFEE